MTEVTVGVDIGTTSVKAVAADADGRVVARARVHHGIRTPSSDRLEHDADLAWRTGVREAFETVARAHEVRAVQVAAMVPSLCAVDESGHALTPGLLYGDARGCAGGSGDPASSGELVGFAEWCLRQAPEAAGLWPAQAMANHALSGVAAVDSVIGLLAGPLFGPQGWDPAVCEAHGIRVDQLPTVVQPGTSIGETDGALLGPGTVDAYTEQLCAGRLAEGDALVICGTTLITWLAVPTWADVPGLWTIPSMAGGEAMVGGPSNAGGLFLEWARRLGGAAEEPAADPAHVPVCLPYIRGERTPLHDPERRASIHDLDLTQGPAELRRAAYEASGFVVRHHLELASGLLGEGRRPSRIVATGGGSQDEEWMQAIADATDLPVHTVAVPEGAAYGAAFLARVVAGLEAKAEAAERWARPGREVAPRQAWVDAMQARYARFRELTASAT
ncbi:MAG TPA: FGGY-family carbohydrate kinase [Acidimicrobiales bacterium]|jgi:xylulokinase|nr:FGGY-family carbohydrate kinase [Acidimicrobiales bacterium]